MDKLSKVFAEILQEIKKLDRDRLARESEELMYYIRKQIFNQIPGVSAIAGILVGSWVASTFTTSPIKGFLASWGLMKGGTHVVSTGTYRFLSVVLPIVATAITAFIVQKVMKAVREEQLQRNMMWVSRLGEDVKSELNEKLNILERAREAGLISTGEFDTKKANLYQTYSRANRSKIEELLMDRLSS